MWRRRINIPIFSFALAALFAAGCSPNSANVFQGYIEGEYVYVASPLGGALTNLAVARGDGVKAGQLLFELERGSEAAAVQQAEKNLAQTKASLVLSEAEFARMEKEMETLERDYRLHQEQFGENALHLNATQRYVNRLLENAKVKRFLGNRYPEILEELQAVAALEAI